MKSGNPGLYLCVNPSYCRISAQNNLNLHRQIGICALQSVSFYLIRTAYEKNRLHNYSNTVLLEYIRSKLRIYLIENRSGSESKDQ
jgi:hypothetical protein